MPDLESIARLIAKDKELSSEITRIENFHQSLKQTALRNPGSNRSDTLDRIEARKKRELEPLVRALAAVRAEFRQLGDPQHIAHASPHTSPRLRIPTQPTIPSVPLAHTGDYRRSEASGILPITPLAAHVPSLGAAQPLMPSSRVFAGMGQQVPRSNPLTADQKSSWNQMIPHLVNAINDFILRLDQLCLQFTQKPLQSNLDVIECLEVRSKWKSIPKTHTKLSKEEKIELIFALFCVINSKLSEMQTLLKFSQEPLLASKLSVSRDPTLEGLTGILSFHDNILFPFGSFLIAYGPFLFAHRNFFHGSKTESEKQLSTLYQMLVQLYAVKPFSEAWKLIFKIAGTIYASSQLQLHEGAITWVQNHFQPPTWADLNAIRDLKVLNARVTMDPDTGVS